MKPDKEAEVFVVSSSPHAHSGANVQGIMLDVLIALLPATAASLFFFGWRAAALICACVSCCVLTEWICRLAMRRENSLADLSACVTGLLLALTLPPDLPVWMALAGSIFSIAVAKQVFGGLGYNPFNPALAGRAFMLVSFTGAMTTWPASGWMDRLASAPGGAEGVTSATTSAAMAGAEALTGATPLGFVKAALKNGQSLSGLDIDGELLRTFFLGSDLNGSLGETCAAALLLGGLYLLVRRVISWHIPVSFILTVFLYALVLSWCNPEGAFPPVLHVLSGGLFLGAFFMATDMVTSPLTGKGKLLFGAGCGLVTMLIRTSKTGAYPEGVCFSILIMNALVPLINRWTANRVFGTGKRA